MADKVEIIGGRSLHGNVAIFSDGFGAEARYHRGGSKITVSAWKRGRGFSSYGIFIFIGVFFLLDIIRGLFMVFDSTLPRVSTQPGLTYWATNIGIMMVAIAWIGIRIAKWHGAEHMVIQAYRTEGKSGLEEARRFSPVADKCGSRFLFAYLLLMVIRAVLLPPAWEWLTALILLIVFFVKPLRPLFTENPVVIFFSRLLQRHITARQPGDVELLTAHCALLGLLKAHGHEFQFPDGVEYEFTE